MKMKIRHTFFPTFACFLCLGLICFFLMQAAPMPAALADSPSAAERVYLSDLPLKSSTVPDGDQVYIDTTWAGGKITVGNAVYDKGISMHPVSPEKPAEAVYDISGLGYTRFTAAAGKDKSAGRDVGGDAGIQDTQTGFEVYVDGVKKAESGNLPYPLAYLVDIDITNAKELKLVVTDGGDGLFCDASSFADAILTKEPDLNADRTYLSSLSPVRTVVPDGDSLYCDTTWSGSKITVGTMVYEKGISMHPVSGEAPAEAVYNIGGAGYTRFTAIVGKDRSAGAQAGQDLIYKTQAGFEVWVDGVKKAESGNLPYPYIYAFDVDLTGAQELKLVVTDGGDGLFCDASSFADAALWKEGTAEADSISLNSLKEISFDVDGGTLYQDTTWLSQKIAVGRRVYEKGISMAPKADSPAEVVYNIENLGYTTFTATVGKDRTAGLQLPNGDDGIIGSRVAFEVYVDGVKKAESGILPYPCTYRFCVDVTGAKTLKLVVTDGGDGIFCDTSSYADPVLSKQTPASADPEQTQPTEPANPVSGDAALLTAAAALCLCLTAPRIFRKTQTFHSAALKACIYTGKARGLP